MTKDEFESFIKQQKDSGKSEEEIVTIFCLMFKDGELDREQFEAVLTALGYEMSEELKSMNDEELKKEVVKMDGETEDAKKEDKIDPTGDKPPVAKDKPEEKEEVEEKTETIKKDEDGDEDEEEERKKAFKLMGLGD
jgi:hypothetical protein